MVAEQDPTPLVVPEPAKPYIAIVFGGEGMADLSLYAPKVTPAQLFAAAFYLSELARSAFGGIQAQAAARQLQSAPAGLLDELRRSGRV